MHNLYQQFRSLLPASPLQVGRVIAIKAGVVTVQLPGQSLLNVRGEAKLDQMVFVRNTVIESVAPNLPVVEIEI